MKLLLVDDEVFSVEALQNTIDWQELGINKIYACYDAEDAKDILSDETIDLMITDIEMPSGSGIDLLKWIDDNKIPVVSMLLTCHPDFAYARDAIRYKAFAYLLKPFQIQEVCDTVKKAQAEVVRIRMEADRDRQLMRLLCQ